MAGFVYCLCWMLKCRILSDKYFHWKSSIKGLTLKRYRSIYLYWNTSKIWMEIHLKIYTNWHLLHFIIEICIACLNCIVIEFEITWKEKKIKFKISWQILWIDWKKMINLQYNIQLNFNFKVLSWGGTIEKWNS